MQSRFSSRLFPRITEQDYPSSTTDLAKILPRARHSDGIRFRRCSKEEELGRRAGNADVLTAHLIEVHKIIADNRIDLYHIAHLDETRISPNHDSLKSSHKKAYVTRSC